MSAKLKIPLTAINPKNPEEVWDVGISEKLYKFHQNKGNEKAIGRIILVWEVLEGGTEEIRKGWSRPGKDEDCFVYLGRPKRDFKTTKIETPAPPGMAFLVFILTDGTIDEWTWRPLSEMEDGGHCPDGVKGEIVWPLNKKSAKS